LRRALLRADSTFVGANMRSRKFARKPSPLPCDEIGPDDGIDPRMQSRTPPRKVHNRKALQLCGQVERTLSSVLQDGCEDEVLRDLLITSVTPAPDSTRLLVTVCRSPASTEVEREEVLVRLRGASAKLRREVAAAIHRRKTPELLFRVATM
jgi:ribosome-binding factor A